MVRTLGSFLRVVYNINGRYEAAYVSEFFKMCGFLVVEQEIPEGVAEYEKIMENYDRYDHNLFLGIDNVDYENYFALDCEKEKERMCRITQDASFVESYVKNDISGLKRNLERTVQQVLNYSGSALSELVKIYVESNYCQLSYIKRYFGNAIEKENQKRLSRDFMNVMWSLEQNQALNNDEVMWPYGMYAQLLCARKVNDICKSMQVSRVFDQEEMVDKCLTILNRVSIFPSAYVLAASFCSCDVVYRASVIPFYESALRGNETHPAMANVYYRMGQYFEKQREDMQRANLAYSKAVSISPQYFRAVFKKGARQLEEKNYQQAIIEYEKIIGILDCKRNCSKLFPVEYEYLCKCYLLIGLIYDYYWKDEWKGGLYYKQAIKLVEDDLCNSSFFEDFMLDPDGIFLQYLKNRIALRKHILVEKYR